MTALKLQGNSRKASACPNTPASAASIQTQDVRIVGAIIGVAAQTPHAHWPRLKPAHRNFKRHRSGPADLSADLADRGPARACRWNRTTPKATPSNSRAARDAGFAHQLMRDTTGVRKDFAVFDRVVLGSVPSAQELPATTHRPETRMNVRAGLAHAREADR